jgi:hypothetical protein
VEAQTPGTEVCNVAFSQGIRDNWVLLTEREQFEAYQDRLCRVKIVSYESFVDTGASLGVDIPLAEALIGIFGSFEDKRSPFRANTKSFADLLTLRGATTSASKASSAG